MRKPELIAAVAKENGLSEAKATLIVNSVFDTITSTLVSGDEVALSGFGTFRVATRAGRPGRNPQTGAPMRIAPGKTPRFTAGAQLKRSVNSK